MSSRLMLPTGGEPKWTLAQLWDEYQKANPALKGMSVYRDIYNAHLSRSFGGKQPAEISPFDLDQLCGRRRNCPGSWWSK